MRRALFLPALALAALPVLRAQTPRFELVLPPAAQRGNEVPAVRSDNLLVEEPLRELLRNGFPARLHYRMELWQAGGLFDHLKGQIEWDVIVRYNALERRYGAIRVEGERREDRTGLGSYEQLRDLEDAIGRAFQPALRPPRPRERYYYAGTLRIEMLSVSDLDEVQRWLRGELGPAVRGEHSAGRAVGQGARTLVARLLGGEERQYEARTSIFRVTP